MNIPISSSDLAYLSASDQSRLIRSRHISPVDLVKACLERIERWNPTLCAYITVCTESALAQAREAEREIAAGRWKGPLHGLPFGVKDQLNTKGIRTTLGSRILAGNIPDHNATVIDRMCAAGAILIGKENLHEFGKGGTEEFPFGQPRNPWNIDHNPAGSSSGSGIAVACGFSSGSLGEDTGGSIRSPAAANGVTGIRPTFGRVSRWGGIMYGWTADTIGPLARSVEDIALFLQAIAGFDPKDPLSSNRPVPDYTASLIPDLKGLTLGVVQEMTWQDGGHPEVVSAIREAIEALKKRGAVIKEVSLSRAKYAVPLQLLTSDSDIAAMMLKKWLRTHWEDFDRGTRTRLAAGALVPAAIYHRAMRARALVRKEVLSALLNVDALLCPTNLVPPGRIDATRETVDSPEAMQKKVLLRRICTYPFSMANVPAIAVPAGYTKTGLPISLQIAGKPFAEETVLRIAYAFERETQWHTRHPDLSRLIAA